MLYVIYTSTAGLHVFPSRFESEEEAQARADTLRKHGFTDAQIVVDLETADATARAMAFTPVPVLGTAGFGVWRDQDATTR